MDSVLFRWVKRSTYDNIRVKDPATLYFIKDEHVFYKGVQEYGGVQSISYEIDADGDYILNITNGDGTQDVLKVASSRRLTRAIEMLQDDLANHITTKANENTSAHTKITDTIDTVNPKDVSDNTAVTPKAVVDYVTENFENFKRYPNMMSFPIVGSPNVIYYDSSSKVTYTYTDGAYEVFTPSWSQIKIIRGDTSINA